VNRALRRIAPPLVLFVAALVVWLIYRDRLDAAEAGMGSSAVRAIAYAVEVLIWLAGAWLLARVLDGVLWDVVLARRLRGRPAPRLLRVMLGVLVFAIAIGAIVGVVFDQSLTGLWATSGVFGVVLGFALRDIIADFFAGLAVNLDRSYEIGDWVEIHYRQINEPLYGRVVEINWRTTRIEMDNRNVVVVPNNAMGTAVIVNYSSPDHPARLEFPLTLDFSIPTDRAMRVLHAGALAAVGALGRARERAEPPRARRPGARAAAAGRLFWAHAGASVIARIG
jgi:small-conductance mechanosensitive channel